MDSEFSFMRRLFSLSAIALMLFSLSESVKANNVVIPIISSVSERVVQTRGRESVVQELNMGPDATDLWHKIQYLIAHLEDIQDFSKLVALFNFSITDPVDEVSPKKPGIQGRYDVKGSYMFENVDYKIGNYSNNKNKRAIGFSIHFYLNAICISASEVRRIYGRGYVGIPNHDGVPPDLYVETAGLMFSEAYGTENLKDRHPPIVFSYMNSGCLKDISFVQPITE